LTDVELFKFVLLGRPMKPVLRDYRVRNWEWLEFNWSPSKEEQLTYSHSQFVNSEVFWHIQG